MKGLGCEPVTGKSWAGQALLSHSCGKKRVSQKVKLKILLRQDWYQVLSKSANSQRPFFSLFGNVDESRGTGPSFSKERSKLAASKHLGWSMCSGKDPCILKIALRQQKFDRGRQIKSIFTKNRVKNRNGRWVKVLYFLKLVLKSPVSLFES